MELRSCGTTHFIKTIRGGRVVIIHNINSQRRSVRSKTLKDIYESEDTKIPLKPSSGLLFNHKQVKHENSCFPQADRTLWETKPETDDEFARADDSPDSDLDDNTTLRQLKKRFITKKRKSIRTGDNFKQHNKRPVEDESDLHEPLINLKPKRVKTSKNDRRHMNLTVDFAVISETKLVYEGSPQVDSNLGPVIRVKVEIPDPEQLGYQNKSHSADASSDDHDEGLNPGGTSTDEFQSMDVCVYREPLLCAQEYQTCVTDESLYGHVEDAEPVYMLVPWDGMSVMLEPSEMEREEFLDSPPSSIQSPEEVIDANSTNSQSMYQTLSVCLHSRSSGIQVFDMDFDGIDGFNGLQNGYKSALSDDKTEADFPYELQDALTSPDMNYISYTGSNFLLTSEENVVSTEDTIADDKQPSKCSLNVINRRGLNFEGHTEGELLEDEGAIPIADAENRPSPKDQTCDIADKVSTQEPCLPPENLLSTRKVVSPSSQERLRLAIDSVEAWKDADQNKYKGKLFEKQTPKKALSPTSDFQYDKVTVNHRRPDKVRQQKIFVKPRHIIKKSQISKGNFEGSRFSRTLPNLSTECTSIQSCSERAIEFSKQQMYAAESLAAKLMNELKSMKDFVEQKLLFEAYRNVSLKNDADEVKSAINNASKVEETSKKWLSIMARDCNRFCKIMKLTPDATFKDTVPRNKRKITFADEAGGNLCQVKIFEEICSVSDDVTQ